MTRCVGSIGFGVHIQKECTVDKSQQNSQIINKVINIKVHKSSVGQPGTEGQKSWYNDSINAKRKNVVQDFCKCGIMVRFREADSTILNFFKSVDAYKEKS